MIPGKNIILRWNFTSDTLNEALGSNALSQRLRPRTSAGQNLFLLTANSFYLKKTNTKFNEEIIFSSEQNIENNRNRQT